MTKKGFTLIELITAITIISILIVSFFSLFGQILKFIQIKKIETQAASLATEQMEVIRNLSYDDVGTIGGIPVGVIAQDQAIARDTIDFDVKTNIRYIDDPYDGVYPDDTLNTDYKQVKITISWDTVWDTDSMFFLTNVVPNGVETTAGGGTLKINVFDAGGMPIPQAKVDIINPGTGVNLVDILTNDNGLILLPGTPADVEGYQITVDKTAYSQARTYGKDDPTGNQSPDPTHLSIYEGQTTEASFSIDLTSSLRIVAELDKSPNPNEPLSNTPFSIHGSKTVGLDSEEDFIYKYPDALSSPPNFITSSSTVVSFWEDTQIELDSYTITFDQPALGHDIIKYDPPNNPITISPNTSETITFTFSEIHSTRSLLVTIADSEENPLGDVNLNLTKDGFEENQITGSTGQAFFADLEEDIYHLIASKTGYEILETDIEVKINEEEKLQMFMAE
jgi:prepilin-type N-terminal cleavage/methylation domain-containing protein